MRTGHLLVAIGVLAGGVTAGAGVASADAVIPIGPHQAFHGLVNGVSEDAQIKVVCPGPASAGQMGHPLAGQTVAVAPGPDPTFPGGYTGAQGVYVGVGYPNAFSASQGLLRYYNAPQPIPTNISLPCAGTFAVSFEPLPGSDGAKPDVIAVEFVNVAV